MAVWNEALRGYVADVPRVVFKRCDGAKFYFDELTAATVSANIETTDIQAGWSLFPVAVLPGASTFTMSLTSGKFDTRIFSMANAIKDTPETESDHAWRDNENYVMSTGEHLSLTLVGQTWEATLDKSPVADSVYIAGLTEASSVATGNFVVSGKKLTFYKDDFNATHSYIDVTYDYIQPAKEAIVTNKESAIGEAVCLWPVYGSGDDCTESDIIGYYIVKVFRARITTIPGMDTSYKSAATFQFELTALDAKRTDEGAYSIAYYLK